MILVGAYGRKYQSEEEVIKDWKEGKDFQIWVTGQYCSIRDKNKLLQEDSYCSIMFNKGQSVFIKDIE